MTAQKQSSSERRRARDRERKRREYQANREQINKRRRENYARNRDEERAKLNDRRRRRRAALGALKSEARARPKNKESGPSKEPRSLCRLAKEAEVPQTPPATLCTGERKRKFSDAQVFRSERLRGWTTFEVLEDFGPLGGPGSNYQQSRKELDEDKRCLFGEFLRAEGPSSVAKKRHRPLPEAQIRKEECVKPETQQANERQDGIVVKLKAPLNGTGDCVPAKDRRIAPGAELSVDAQETSEQRRKRLARERQRRHRAKRSLMKQSSQPIVHMAPGDLALDRFVNTSGRRTEASGTMPDASGSMSPRKASSIAPDAESTSDAEEFAAAIMASLFWANFSASH